jgi:hypothetical protein
MIGRAANTECEELARDRLTGASRIAAQPRGNDVGRERASSRARCRAVNRELCIADHARGDVRERWVCHRRRLRRQAARNAGEISAVRLRNARQQIRALEDGCHVLHGRRVGHAWS